MATSGKVYNINEMREALIAARKTKNEKVIDKALCAQLGIAEGYFDMHKALCRKLHAAVCDYLTVKHTPNAEEKDIKASEQKVWDIWKSALSSAEKKKNEKEIKCSPYDVEDLVTFVATFSDSRNDDKGRKVWSVNSSENVFRKKVETMLGIRIEGAAALTSAESEYLFTEKRLLKSIRSTEKAISDGKESIKTLTGLMNACTTDEAKKIYKADIEELKAQQKERKVKLEKSKQSLETLYADHADLHKKFSK